MPISKWDKKFLTAAQFFSTWSKDKSRQVGSVAVGPDNEIRAIGYNGMPRGVDDNLSCRHERPKKYLFFEHAERNLIYNCARIGTPLKGCKIYLQWFPCAGCARGIVQSGLIEVICKKPDSKEDERWMEEFEAALEILNEAKVKITYYDETN
jgi:dCMP deaminase